MIPAARSFKQPQTLDECVSLSCRECATMCDMLLFPAYGWDCFKMEKAKEYRVSISLKVRA